MFTSERSRSSNIAMPTSCPTITPSVIGLLVVALFDYSAVDVTEDGRWVAEWFNYVGRTSVLDDLGPATGRTPSAPWARAPLDTERSRQLT